MTAVLDKSKWSIASKLAQAMSPTDTIMRISTSDLARFKPESNTHYYLTIRSCSRFEVVRVTAARSDGLCVDRGIDNTTATDWPVGSCISFEWNPSQLCEFVAGCGHAGTTGITGTVCTDCSTCLTLVDGVIVGQEGGKPCSDR